MVENPLLFSHSLVVWGYTYDSVYNIHYPVLKMPH